MSLIKDTWRHMVQRRLWPLALLLVAAVVAVPMVLAKDPQPLRPEPLAAATPGAAADAAADKPVVALATSDDSRRHVLGARKDPFRPAETPTPTPTPKSSQSSSTTTTTTGTGGTGGTGTSGGATNPTPVGGSPTAPTTPPAKRTYPGDSLTVRFGAGADPKTVLEANHGLPQDTADDATPLLVYVGLAKGGKEALFLVDASVKADGDGRCDSDSASACETLHLSAGETEFLDVVDETGAVTNQYQLDLVAIHPSKQTLAKAAKAKAAKQHDAKSARAATAAVVSAAGAASAGGGARFGAGIGALLGSL